METGRIISAGFAMPLNGIASARSGVFLSGVLTWGGMVAPNSGNGFRRLFVFQRQN